MKISYQASKNMISILEHFLNAIIEAYTEYQKRI
jgi:hypothetical protein